MALTPSKQTPEEKKTREEEVLLREVDDAVRQDEFGAFADRYGKLLIAVLVLGLLAFGGYLWWSGQQEAERERQSEAIVSALDNVEAGNLDTASAKLDPVIAEGGAGASALARMMKAGLALENGDTDEAAELFQALADDGDAPQALRDLARIRAVSVRYDRMKPADVIAELRPLAVPGNEFFGSAGELVAMAYLEQGKREEAGALFAQIAKDENTPISLQARTRQMAGLLGVDAIEDVDELLEEQRVEAAPTGQSAQ
ncbi:MAG: tetratricopeptide repeat protein [Alteripontixanthobacter sp.]